MSGNLTVVSNKTTSLSINVPPRPPVLDFDILSRYVFYRIGRFIETKMMFVCVGVGLPGNLISAITLLRSGTVNSSILFLLTLAVADSLNLIMKTILIVVLEHQQIVVGNVGCRTLGFFGYFLTYWPIWITVLLTIERFVAVRFPFYVARLFKIRKAIFGIAMTVLLITAANMHHWFFWYEHYFPSGEKICAVLPEFTYATTYTFWIDAAIYTFIPCTMLTILNSIIIFSLWRSSIIRGSATPNNTSDSFKQNKAITQMLLTVSIVTLILLLPKAISTVVLQLDWNFKGDYPQFATIYFLYWFVLFCADLNSSINFFLYVLSGRRFRRVFVATFLPCVVQRDKIAQSQVGTSLTNIDSHSVPSTSNE